MRLRCLCSPEAYSLQEDWWIKTSSVDASSKYSVAISQRRSHVILRIQFETAFANTLSPQELAPQRKAGAEVSALSVRRPRPPVALCTDSPI